MNPQGVFLVFVGALVVVQVVGGKALSRLNVFGEPWDPGNALGGTGRGPGTGGLLLPPGTGLNPTGPPPPLVAPMPGRPIPGDVPGVTGAQPSGIGDYLGGLAR